MTHSLTHVNAAMHWLMPKIPSTWSTPNISAVHVLRSLALDSTSDL